MIITYDFFYIAANFTSGRRRGSLQRGSKPTHLFLCQSHLTPPDAQALHRLFSPKPPNHQVFQLAQLFLCPILARSGIYRQPSIFFLKWFLAFWLFRLFLLIINLNFQFYTHTQQVSKSSWILKCVVCLNFLSFMFKIERMWKKCKKWFFVIFLEFYCVVFFEVFCSPLPLPQATVPGRSAPWRTWASSGGWSGASAWAPSASQTQPRQSGRPGSSTRSCCAPHPNLVQRG